jgi:hypothetical protein
MGATGGRFIPFEMRRPFYLVKIRLELCERKSRQQNKNGRSRFNSFARRIRFFEKLKARLLTCAAFATSLRVATALALATVRAFLTAAAALAFATVFAGAIMLARITGWRVRAGRVCAVLRKGFHGEARHQSRDRRRD